MKNKNLYLWLTRDMLNNSIRQISKSIQMSSTNLSDLIIESIPSDDNSISSTNKSNTSNKR